MNIDELKILAQTVQDLELTERQLALFRDYEGDILWVAIEWTPQLNIPGQPPPHSYQVRLKAAEVIDTIVAVLERRVERLRATLNGAGVA